MEAFPPKRILVVDDEETVRTICVRMLSPLGYTVVTANNGDEAFKLIVEDQPFDLLITDYRMPGSFNGLEIGQAMKVRFPETKIILMTAFPALDTAVETL